MGTVQNSSTHTVAARSNNPGRSGPGRMDVNNGGNGDKSGNEGGNGDEDEGGNDDDKGSEEEKGSEIKDEGGEDNNALPYRVLQCMQDGIVGK